MTADGDAHSGGTPDVVAFADDGTIPDADFGGDGEVTWHVASQLFSWPVSFGRERGCGR